MASNIIFLSKNVEYIKILCKFVEAICEYCHKE